VDDVTPLAVRPEKRDPAAREVADVEAVEGALNLFKVFRNDVPGDSGCSESNSCSARRVLTGEFETALIVLRGGGNSRKSSSSSSNCRYSSFAMTVDRGGGNESSLFLPLMSESEEKNGLDLRGFDSIGAAPSLLADELLRLASALSFFASSFRIAAALLNPPMPAKRFDVEEVERILFVRSAPAPRALTAVVMEGPAINSISLLLASGSLDVDALLLILVTAVPLPAVVAVVGREDDDR